MDIHFTNYLLTLSLLIYGLGICYVCSCRSDYNIKDGSTCYRYFTTSVSWEQADRLCKDDNASLIKIDEVNVFKLVQSIMKDLKSSIWVGARRRPISKNIQWLDGDDVSRFWNSGAPNNYQEECVEAKYYNYPASLNDRQCVQKLSFVCEDLKSSIWVGARRPISKNIQWLDGDDVSRFWNSGAPNNYQEECVEAKYYNYPASLNDRQCVQKLSFVCEGKCRSDYARNGTICYKYFADAVSWEEADRQCKGDNATLIKIDKRDTLSLLQLVVIKNVVRSIWVGARTQPNSRKFQWIDGTNVSQFWNAGEPSNLAGDEDCVEFVIGTPGFLDDQLCKLNRPFVCEAQETSAELTTQGVAQQGTPQDKSDATLLAVKIALPLVVLGLLTGAVTVVVCIHLKRRRRQTSANDDTATAPNPADHYYLTPFDSESNEYHTIEL